MSFIWSSSFVFSSIRRVSAALCSGFSASSDPGPFFCWVFGPLSRLTTNSHELKVLTNQAQQWDISVNNVEFKSVT
ncbi:hypothetical protein EYF80_044064 [Liparis tanakae]|uniref:Secreted protein n=1 Tax=Liparis tanakae TaxID=230148 RepID=A0A4Z2FYW7_9TELE|nr:hypothetical protein EYF80_044064 [Liparis tanakae]